MPSSRGSSRPRDGTQVSLMAGGFFANSATREAHILSTMCEQTARGKLCIPHRAQLGAMGWPQRVGWGGGRWGYICIYVKREGLCVYIWLIHTVGRQKVTQRCKAIIFQLTTTAKNQKNKTSPGEEREADGLDAASWCPWHWGWTSSDAEKRYHWRPREGHERLKLWTVPGREIRSEMGLG